MKIRTWSLSHLLFSLAMVAALGLLLVAAPVAHAWPGDMVESWTSTELDDTRSMAWGDWDGDGDPDLAVGNYNQPNHIYRNTNGNLSLVWSSTEQDATTALAWTDLDGDGDLDLAAGNYGDPWGGQPARVYRNDSAGSVVTMTLAWTAPFTEATTALAWGDLDGDGHLDLAVGNDGQPNRAYRNDGGSLALAWTAPLTEATTALAWGDWDGDGDPDLAVGNRNRPKRIYRNDAGALSLAWSSDEINQTTSLAWGDWDSDGDLDLAAGNDGETNQVYRNDGGSLSLTWSSPDRDDTRSVAWGDWDGDGDLDLAAGNTYNPNRIYRNDTPFLNGARALALAWSAPVAEDRTTALAWVDLDADGAADLAVGNGDWSARPNRVYRNAGAHLALAWSSTEEDDTRSTAWGDVDADGDLDLAVGNAGGWWGQPNRLYRNDGGSLALAWTSDERGGTHSLAWGDVDGDGDLDLAVGNDGPNQLYRNDDGELVLAWSSDEGDSTTALAWGDVDGDGDLDLVAGNSGSWWGPQPSRLYCNDGGELSLAWSSLLSDTVHSLAWGDWDGDGDLDLAVGNWGQPNRVYRNEAPLGSGEGGVVTMTLAWTAPITEQTTSLAWGDADGDGDLDLAAGSELAPCRVYRNNAGALSLAWSSPEANNTTALAWGDADGDGDLDLAAGNRGQPNRVYRNDSDPSTGIGFRLTWSSPEMDDTEGLTWGDADGDGDLDLAVANGGALGQANRLYRNEGEAFTIGWSSDEIAQTTALAWGDADGDGDLDLALGNVWSEWSPDLSRIYRNDAPLKNGAPFHGALSSGWTLSETDNVSSLAWGDADGDGDLDLAVGNDYGLPNRLYRNRDGELSLAWTSAEADSTRSLAWGDWDGDGDLDLAVGNGGQPNRVYRNQDGALSLAWSSPEDDWTAALAWGDWDGDGDLDLAVGNGGQPNRVYRNTGGDLILAWSAPVAEDTHSLAWGDWDGDGEADLAVGNNGYSQLYRNAGDGTLALAWTFPSSDDTRSVAWGDADADGDLDLALGGYSQPLRVYRNDVDPTGSRQFTLWWSSPDGSFIQSLAWGDADGDGDLDLAAGRQNKPSRVYLNRSRPAQRLLNSPPSLSIAYPGKTGGANFYAEADILQGSIPITYSLFDPDGEPVRFVRAFYSLDGGGRWLPALGAFGTVTTHLATLPSQAGPTNTHVFNWDVYASGFFGQSDDVVFRILAYPDSRPQPGGGSGPYQYTYGAGVQTLPFRVRGSQVRVMQAVLSGTVTSTLPVSQAVVYRLTAGQAAPAAPVTDNAGQPLRTNLAGYLPGRGQLNPGDRLAALLPVAIIPTQLYAPLNYDAPLDAFHLYYASAAPSELGWDDRLVRAPGVQTLTVSADKTLLVVDLDLSLEWDARNDGSFLDELDTAVQQASALLYDVSDGQLALGDVRLHQAKSNWLGSDIVLYAQNGVRPRATMGGVVEGPTDDVISATLTISNAYAPGQVRLGPNWDPFGQSLVELGRDWQRALAHELAHYLLFLPDNYLGLDEAGRLIETDCQGSFMTNTYDDAYSELLTRAGWVGDCRQTIAERLIGRTDWETVQRFYPALHAPAAANTGPARLPLALTRLVQVDPSSTAATLPPRFFDLRDANSLDLLYLPQAQGYLFKTRGTSDLADDGLIALGSAWGSGDRIKLRGAEAGDRLCVLAPYDESTGLASLGCIESLAALDVSLKLHAVPGWQPDILVRPVNSRTLAVTVTLLAALPALNVQVLPAYGSPTDTLPPRAPWAAMQAADPENSLTFTQVITLDQPAFEGWVRVWVPGSEEPREALSRVFVNPAWGPIRRGFGGNTRAWGANVRQLGAPVASGDGQVTIWNAEDLFADMGAVSLQALGSLPHLPAWLAPVGQGYRFVAEDDAPRQIVFEYLQRDVPSGYEHSLRVYYSPDEGQTWHRLATELNLDYNRATARMPGEVAGGQGIYALLSTVEMPRLQPGWNAFGYPLPGSRALEAALASIEGAYTSVYFYDPAASRWQLYDATVLEQHPDYAALVNDLAALEFGRSYWLYATEAITPYLGVPSGGGSRLAAASADPLPATFYGPLSATPHFTPAAGMTVTAYVGAPFPNDAAACGSGVVTDVAGLGLAYALQLAPDTGDGCGAGGRAVAFSVGEQCMADTFVLPSAWNRQAWYHPLRAPAAALELFKTVELAQAPAHLGGLVTYTLVLSNSGAGPASGVVLTDRLPAGLGFGSWIITGSAHLPPPGDTVTWGPWDIPAGTAYAVRFTAIVTTESTYYGQVITNTAAFSSTGAGAGSSSAAFAIQPRPEYRIYLPLVLRSA
jgi:uncharacterized repeat protein (TIGR01451 family)